MKNLLLAFCVLLSAIVGFIAAVAAAVWIFPGALVNVADRALEPHGLRVAVMRVRGTPGTGWIFEGLTFRGPGFDGSVRRLLIDIDWQSTFLGRPALAALWADGARVRVRPSASDKPTARSRKPSGPPTLVPIDSLRLVDGGFTLEQPGKKPFRVSGIALNARVTAARADVAAFTATVRGNRIEARGHYEPVQRTGALEARVPGFVTVPGLPERTVGPLSLFATMNGDQVTLRRLFAVVEQSTVAAEGTIHFAPVELRMHLESRGPLEIRADVRGDPARWSASAVGVQKTSRFTAIASYAVATQAWKTMVHTAGLPASLVPGLPPTLGALSADVAASGRGTAPSDLSGRAHVTLAATNGPHLAADVNLIRGNAQTTVLISSGGVSGRMAGRWQLARGIGQASADVTLGAALRGWLPVSAEGPVHLDVRGPQKRLAWNFNARLQKISSGDVSVDRLSVDGAGSSLAPPAGRLALTVAGVQAGREKMEKASLTVDGRLTHHVFELAMEREGASLKAAGRGRLAGGRWSSTWTRLDANLGQPWSLSAPFDLAVGAGAVSVRALRLVSNVGGALAVDGGISAGNIRGLRVSARGLRLDGLRKLAGLDLSIEGTASADLRASGPLSAPAAQGIARLSGLSVDHRPAGDVDLAARLAGGRAAIERLNLVSRGGTLAISGDVPLSWSGRKTPAFRIRVQTAGLDPAALPVPLGGWVVEGGRLEADLTVSGHGGTFSASGPLRFTAGRVAEGDKKTGTELKDIRIRLAGDGESLRVVEAVAKGGDGTATLSGRVAATHADLVLAARGFEYRHPAGVTARFNADLSLRGAWDAPRLAGRVDIVKGSFQPVKEKKEKKAETDKQERAPATEPSPRPAASAPSSPMSADIAVAFPNNVWYRDGQTAIEVKGDLRVRKDAAAPWLVFGTVETLRGDYFFYGRAFSIQQGRLTFTGEEPLNPRLELTAVNQNQANNVTVTITGSGTLRDPRIALSSQPPMDETDIIAVLVTGSPMGADHQSAGGEEMARSVAANYLAEKVRQQVQNKVRLDVLQLHLGENGQRGDVTIGERVSKNLFLSYGQTLESDAERRVNAEYVLTPRFSLQGQTTNIGRYVLDLLFKFGFY